MQNYKTKPLEAQKPILMHGKRLSWAELSDLFARRQREMLLTN